MNLGLRPKKTNQPAKSSPSHDTTNTVSTVRFQLPNRRPIPPPSSSTSTSTSTQPTKKARVESPTHTTRNKEVPYTASTETPLVLRIPTQQGNGLPIDSNTLWEANRRTKVLFRFFNEQRTKSFNNFESRTSFIRDMKNTHVGTMSRESEQSTRQSLMNSTIKSRSALIYQGYWAKYIFFCLVVGIPTRFHSEPSPIIRLERFAVFYTDHIRMAPSSLWQHISGILWVFNLLNINMHGMNRTVLNKLIHGYEKVYKERTEKKPPPAAPPMGVIMKLFTFTMKEITNEIEQKIIIALIGMQCATSIRPGQIWYPGHSYPHELTKVGFVYKSERNQKLVRIMSTNTEDWKDTPQSISIYTCLKNSDSEVELGADANDLFEEDAYNDQDFMDSEEYEHTFTAETDGKLKHICFVRNFHSLMKRFPPRSVNSHILSGIPEMYTKGLANTAKKLVKKFAAAQGIQNLTLRCFRSTAPTHMAEAGATMHDVMAQGAWRSSITPQRHYIGATSKGHKATAASAIYSSGDAVNRPNWEPL